MQYLLLFGIPTAITTTVLSVIVWLFKKHLDKSEKLRQEREKNLEDLILKMMQSTRASCVCVRAIASAVQRIPDAHCNGDMTRALATMDAAQQDEKQFLIDKGVKFIFDNTITN